ncbi:MAG TPA: 2-phospho-L-lactate transferase [Tetrasphaera sp.]|uniref:2-phospho-L-lactate transferase n=1 Tax=Nostocoides sp. TaxID=1917966 RepID=UPI002D0AE253|nr:2-phospho-L-lactate transferase [Tetrasphaera sp.]HNQ08226.1 2-phospho-L-lactate transferase [Tetrasphaera sp.]
MLITALAGGVGGARFLRGLRDALDADPALAQSDLTIVANTGDDITLFGLRVSPDVDTLLYTLGGGIDEAQGWGRADDSRIVQGELAAYGVGPQWFGLGDRDFGTHIARSYWLGEGLQPTAITERLATRWGLPEQRITLLPMTDAPVETHVVVERADGPQAIHFQQWWVEDRTRTPAQRFVVAGLDRAAAAPGVLDAIREADLVILPPSNPVVSIGIILGVPGVRDALRGTTAPVVGVSPLIGGRPVRGHADACLSAIGVESSAAGVASLYADFLDGWLIDPADAVAGLPGLRVETYDRELLMGERAGAARLARAALDLGLALRNG